MEPDRARVDWIAAVALDLAFSARDREAAVERLLGVIRDDLEALDLARARLEQLELGDRTTRATATRLLDEAAAHLRRT